MTTLTSIADAIAAVHEAERVNDEYERAHPAHTEETIIASNLLNEAVGAAEDEVGLYPVTRAADLLIKINFMRDRDTFQQAATEDWIAADVARLAGGRAPWDHAFAVFEAALAADDAINAVYDAARAKEQARMEADWGRAGDVLHDATWQLFDLPAPDHDALMWKAETLFGECVERGEECPAWRADIIASYMADVRRLVGAA